MLLDIASPKLVSFFKFNFALRSLFKKFFLKNKALGGNSEIENRERNRAMWMLFMMAS